MMAEYLFKIQDLIHSYDGSRNILNIPSLTFEEGKIHAIIGPNGSGKTTLCSILGLLLKPTKGKVLYREKNIYENGEAVDKLRKKITMVHQNPFLFNTTVEKNVAYGLRVRKYPRSQWKPKVEECLKLMGIEHLRRRQANCLSGGETQRVALARALAIEPEVLILDEFTANVDQNYVQIMENVIQDVFRQKKITIFLVTHDEKQALRIADTSTHIVDGKIAENKPLIIY
jgi:tungstate transport system ATP-binding protein